jgi:LacI family transcriptional regulator
MAIARKPTMTDVAREAGVSLSTVDRVLNGRGGVDTGKASRIVGVARRLKLDRSLAQRPSRALRVAVLIQPPTNPFHWELRQGIDVASKLYADLNLQFLVHHVDPNQPAKIAALIQSQTARCNGLIVTVPDHPLVAAALREASAQIPVVTLADDVADSGRAAYVGPDDQRAGRIAGDLMGRLLRPNGGHVVMIIGLAELRGHREREAGFRGVLAEFYPETAISEVIESREEQDRAGLIAHRAFAADPEIRGFYLCTTGAQQLVQSLQRLDKHGRIALIVHELTDSRRALLRQRAIDAVIDQNPALEVQVAVETIARLFGRLEGDPGSTVTDMRIYMPENA